MSFGRPGATQQAEAGTQQRQSRFQAVAVSLRLATRGRLGRHIQFGPFLAAGALLFFLAGPELISAYFGMIGSPELY